MPLAFLDLSTFAAFASNVSALAAGLGPWAYALVFLFAVGEALPFVGFFLPGQWVVLLAGFAVAQGAFALGPMLALAVLGGVLGDAAGYYAGRIAGPPLLRRRGRWLRLTPAAEARIRALFARYGPVALVFARFTLVTRSLGPLFAGVHGMRPAVFWPVNVFGAAFWAATYFFLGYLFGESTARLGQALGGTAVVFGIAAAVAFGVVWWVGRKKVKRAG